MVGGKGLMMCSREITFIRVANKTANRIGWTILWCIRKRKQIHFSVFSLLTIDMQWTSSFFLRLQRSYMDKRRENNAGQSKRLF